MFALKLRHIVRHDAFKLGPNFERLFTDATNCRSPNGFFPRPLQKDCSGVFRSDPVEWRGILSSSCRGFSLLGDFGRDPVILKAVKNGDLVKRTMTDIKRGVERTKKGPITWKSFLISFALGSMFVGYLVYLKNEKMKLREKDRKRILGKAQIGGRFDLVDQDNNPVKSEDFFGDWLLVYFGFTHCPDICPDEIEKMVEVVNEIDKRSDMQKVKPIFITVDPERDTPSVVKKYVKEFSEKITGLTGTVDQVAKVCKAFRVYFSPGPKDSDADYIVDHSIIMYLIDPEGNFIDYFGQNRNASQIVYSIHFNQVKYDSAKSKNLKEKLQDLVFG